MDGTTSCADFPQKATLMQKMAGRRCRLVCSEDDTEWTYIDGPGMPEAI